MTRKRRQPLARAPGARALARWRGAPSRRATAAAPAEAVTVPRLVLQFRFKPKMPAAPARGSESVAR